MSGKPPGIQITSAVRPMIGEARSADDICEVVTTAREIALNILERRAAKKPAPRVDCAKGCTHCCHIRVDTSPLEVLALGHWLRRNLDEKSLAQLSERVGRAEEQTRGLSEAGRAAAGIACPLLVDQQCMAYEARPFDCQGYESTDVETCRQGLANYNINNIALNKKRYRVLLDAQRALMGVSKRLGRDARMVDLIPALRIVLKSDDAALRWISGEPLFAEAALEKAV